jgi:hypothetical protein
MNHITEKLKQHGPFPFLFLTFSNEKVQTCPNCKIRISLEDDDCPMEKINTKPGRLGLGDKESR